MPLAAALACQCSGDSARSRLHAESLKSTGVFCEATAALATKRR
jgi:hypothetical protein